MSLPNNKLLELNPDAVEALRRQYNLDGPGRMEQAVNILREWIKQQPHILKKDFSPTFLEVAIILCKGSLEKAKKIIDKRCTFKTLQPQFFGLYDVNEYLQSLKPKMNSVVLPKQTPDYYRVYICKVIGDKFTTEDIFKYFKIMITMADYVVNSDCLNGLMVVMDYSEMNLFNLVAAYNLITLKNFLLILIESYAARLKGFYMITKSSAVELFISMIKPCFGKKIADRIHVLGTPQELGNILPTDILPKEYGGTEGPLQDIFEKWIDVLTSEENLNLMKDLDKAGTDESLRSNDKEFSEEYAGISGTFRYLTVD